MIFLDTNIIVRLYNGNSNLLSNRAKQFIEKNNIYISPMVILELEYLYEIKRVNEQSKNAVNYLSDKLGLKIDEINFSEIIEYAVKETWTRDPFDRIIVSHAKKRKAYLISADSKIQKHYDKTVT